MRCDDGERERLRAFVEGERPTSLGERLTTIAPTSVSRTRLVLDLVSGGVRRRSFKIADPCLSTSVRVEHQCRFRFAERSFQPFS